MMRELMDIAEQIHSALTGMDGHARVKAVRLAFERGSWCQDCGSEAPEDGYECYCTRDD